MAATQHYRAPTAFDRKVMNPLIGGLSRLGISFWGSRVLEVRGRKSGAPRRVPVNPLTLDGERYLVAPRGHTQWVRNLRAAGEGWLLLGRRREHFTATEQFFDGVGPDSESSELARIAPDHPVFRVS